MSVCCCGTCPDCVAYRARIAAIDTASAALRTKVQGRISNARFARLTLTERPFGWQDSVLSGDFSLIMDMWGKPLFFVSTDGVRDLVVPWENVLYAETKELATEDPR